MEKNLVMDAVYFMLKHVRLGEKPDEETVALINYMHLNYFQVLMVNQALVSLFSYYQLDMNDDGSIKVVYQDPFGDDDE